MPASLQWLAFRFKQWVWPLIFAALGLGLWLSLFGTDLGSGTYALVVYGAVLGFFFDKYMGFDEFQLGTAAWLGAWSGGFVALNHYILGLSAWWAPGFALVGFVVGIIAGVLLMAASLGDEVSDYDEAPYFTGYGATAS